VANRWLETNLRPGRRRSRTVFEARQAVAADVEFARQLHHAAYYDVVIAQFGHWDKGQQDRFFLAKWDPPKTRIIERDGIPIGTIRIDQSDDHVFLSEIQILPVHQGQGIGSMLIREVLAQRAFKTSQYAFRFSRRTTEQESFMNGWIRNV